MQNLEAEAAERQADLALVVRNTAAMTDKSAPTLNWQMCLPAQLTKTAPWDCSPQRAELAAVSLELEATRAGMGSQVAESEAVATRLREQLAELRSQLATAQEQAALSATAVAAAAQVTPQAVDHDEGATEAARRQSAASAQLRAEVESLRRDLLQQCADQAVPAQAGGSASSSPNMDRKQQPGWLAAVRAKRTSVHRGDAHRPHVADEHPSLAAPPPSCYTTDFRCAGTSVTFALPYGPGLPLEQTAQTALELEERTSGEVLSEHTIHLLQSAANALLREQRANEELAGLVSGLEQELTELSAALGAGTAEMQRLRESSCSLQEEVQALRSRGVVEDATAQERTHITVGQSVPAHVKSGATGTAVAGGASTEPAAHAVSYCTDFAWTQPLVALPGAAVQQALAGLCENSDTSGGSVTAEAAAADASAAQAGGVDTLVQLRAHNSALMDAATQMRRQMAEQRAEASAQAQGQAAVCWTPCADQSDPLTGRLTG
eukprot:COSAG01_NODE_1397_length_10467_cov_9.010706_8_plen_493_part_00